MSSWRSDYVGLVTRLRRAREAAGLRQVDVAAAIGVSVRHFARLEAAEIDPQARALFAWAAAVRMRINLTDMSGDATGEHRTGLSGSEAHSS